MALACIGLGMVLGYAAATSNLAWFAKAQADSTPPPLVAPATPGEAMPCCSQEPSKASLVAQITAHNARVGAKAMQDGKTPNICIIGGDDIGQSNISAYSMGLMGYHTPNIDRVAKEGMM